VAWHAATGDAAPQAAAVVSLPPRDEVVIRIACDAASIGCSLVLSLEEEAVARMIRASLAAPHSESGRGHLSSEWGAPTRRYFFLLGEVHFSQPRP
jgi:hypothetical protein